MSSNQTNVTRDGANEMSEDYIFHPSQNISKNESTKINVFGLNFAPNTLIFIGHFLLIFWDRESNYYKSAALIQSLSNFYATTCKLSN
jgi:hypothetical protein